MRLGLAIVSAAAVFGAYTLVNTLSSRPVAPDGATPVAEERGWLPGAIEEPAAETRSYELIRYVDKDGSFGMVDDPTRVPAGATIMGRERKTVAVAKAVPSQATAADPISDELEEEAKLERMVRERQQSSQRLVAIQRRVMESVLGSGLAGDKKKLGQVQDDIGAMQREAERMDDCEDGDCADLAEPAPAETEMRSPVPRKTATAR